jgi:hypothetical protein
VRIKFAVEFCNIVFLSRDRSPFSRLLQATQRVKFGCGGWNPAALGW